MAKRFLAIGVLLCLCFGASCRVMRYEDGEAAYNARDYAKALQIMRPLAEKGDAKAQFFLGRMHYNGEGVLKDYAEAVKWYRMAAEQGAPYAQNNLGNMYYNGEGVGQDYAEAEKWYRRAAEQGDPQAQNSLGMMYDHGRGVPADDSEAMDLFSKAAEQGNAYAQYNLGLMYSADPAKRSIALDLFYRAGMSFLDGGDRENALNALDRIKELSPDHFLARQLQGKIYPEVRK